MLNEVRSCAQGACEFDQGRYCPLIDPSQKWHIELWNTLLQDLTPRRFFLKMKKTLLVCFCASSLWGCATTQQLSQSDRQALSTVSVDQKVEFEEQPMFMNHTRALGGGLAGVIGYGVAAAATSGVSDEGPAGLIQYMKQNNISIPDIVRNEFIDQIKIHPNLESRLVERNGAAQFHLKAGWGMGQESVGALYHPALFVWAELVTDGKVIWRGNDYITPLSGDIQGRTWQDLFTSPEVLRQLYANAAQHVISTMLKGI
jgi:hypothetical protein